MIRPYHLTAAIDGEKNIFLGVVDRLRGDDPMIEMRDPEPTFGYRACRGLYSCPKQCVCEVGMISGIRRELHERYRAYIRTVYRKGQRGSCFRRAGSLRVVSRDHRKDGAVAKTDDGEAG